MGGGGVREGMRPSAPEGRVYHAGWTRGGGGGEGGGEAISS